MPWLRLDDETDAALCHVCARTGLSPEEAVKAAIAALIKRAADSPGKLAEVLGIIGCFESDFDHLGRNHSRYIEDKLRHRHRDQNVS